MIINSDHNIFKVHERVFLIGELFDIDLSFLLSIINIINNGGKFVPSLNTSIYSIFKNLLYFFDNEFSKLNMKFFLNKYYNNTCNMDSFDSSISQIISNDSDSIDIFFTKTKILKDTFSFSLLNESIDFRLELFKYFSNLKFDIKNNLSDSEIKYLFKFIKNKPFKVIDTDKNVGLAILSNELHDTLILSHLNDCNTYSIIENFNLDNIILNINDTLLDLKIF